MGITPARVTKVSYQEMKPRMISEIIIVINDLINIETFVLKPS